MSQAHSQEDAFQGPRDEVGPAKRRYFFDVLDKAVLIIDEEGTELETAGSVELEAARVAVELAKGRLPGAKRYRELVVVVRDETGPVLKTTLSLTIEPLAQDPGSASFRSASN